MAENDKDKLLRLLVRRTPEGLLLARMQALGFWPAGLGLPPDPPEEAEERAQVEREIRELVASRSATSDPEAALAEERRRRWADSKKRRAEVRAKREEEQKNRRETWESARKDMLVYAGRGVGRGLDERSSDVDALKTRGLPVFHSSNGLAVAMELPLSRLRWLTFHRKGATIVHYHRYEVPKKTGGMRAISAPKPELAAAQRWVLENILERLPTEPPAHGFVPGRSIVTCAAPHVGRAVVLNMDVRDFFPSITFRRVKGLFKSLGYSEHVATVLGLLCTEPPRLHVEVNERDYHVALGERMVPQGACTSPAITNLICRDLDRRLAGIARRRGFAYTRYADDLTFSGEDPRAVGGFLSLVRAILQDEGLEEHDQKTRVMRRGRRQQVTGVTVNDRMGADRRYIRELRAILYNAARYGLDSQNREGHPHFEAYLRGRIEFVSMVDPRRRPQLEALLARARGQ
jgi:retron-type reverse transcriptase